MRKTIKICPFAGIGCEIINSAQHATLVSLSNEHPQIGLKNVRSFVKSTVYRKRITEPSRITTMITLSTRQYSAHAKWERKDLRENWLLEMR